MGDLYRSGACILTDQPINPVANQQPQLQSFSGKVAIVTGGARGIGESIVQAFVQAGAYVIAADLITVDDQPHDGNPLIVRCDVGQPDQVAVLIETAVDAFGRIDILVNNAGLTGGSGPFLDVKLEDWNRYLHTNLTGAFIVGQAAARSMVEHKIPGRIINIGSVNSFAAEPEASPYVASKGGILLLTKAMAVDLARYGILVNCIAPGPIRVDRNAPIFDNEPLRSGLERTVPLGKPGVGADIANAVLFLCSEQNQFITGASLLIDGGHSAVLNFT